MSKDTGDGGKAPKETEGRVEATPTEVAPPKEVQSAIRKLSESKPEKMFEMLSIAGGIGMGNPLHNKMEPQHITQVLDLAIKHDEREFELYKTKEANTASSNTSNRRYIFATFVVIVILVLVVLFLFKDKPEVLIPILTGIGGLASGFAGGFGIGRKSTSK